MTRGVHGRAPPPLSPVVGEFESWITTTVRWSGPRGPGRPSAPGSSYERLPGRPERADGLGRTSRYGRDRDAGSTVGECPCDRPQVAERCSTIRQLAGSASQGGLFSQQRELSRLHRAVVAPVRGMAYNVRNRGNVRLMTTRATRCSAGSRGRASRLVRAQDGAEQGEAGRGRDGGRRDRRGLVAARTGRRPVRRS